MVNEELEKIQRRLRENSLGMSISRVPKETKLKFQEVALAFSEDYGLCLKWILDQAIEYQEFKKVFFKVYELENRLNQIEIIINNQEQKEPQREELEKKGKIITTLGGKKIELKGGNQK